MEFLGVGPAEAIVVFILILILVGPQRFPELMRQGGRWYRIARGYTTEVMKDVRAAVDELEQEVKEEAEDLQSIREIGDMGRELEQDLSETKRDLDSTDADAAAAARAATDGEPGAPRPISSAPSAGTGAAAPSSRLLSHARNAEEGAASADSDPAPVAASATPEANSSTDDSAETAMSQPVPSSTAPAGPRPASPPPPAQRISLPEDDPFRALEARRAAAQESDDPDASDDGEEAGA